MEKSRLYPGSPIYTAPMAFRIFYHKSVESLFAPENDYFWKEYNVLWHRQTKALGFPPPKIQPHDSTRLDENEVAIQIRGRRVYTEPFYVDRVFWPGRSSEESNGIYESYERFDEADGCWTASTGNDDTREDAEPLEVEDVFLSHLGVVTQGFADELLMRDIVHFLVEGHANYEPSLVNDIFPDRITPTELHEVLKSLLRENLSIQPLGRILETLDASIDEAESINELIQACVDELDDIENFSLTDSRGILNRDKKTT